MLSHSKPGAISFHSFGDTIFNIPLIKTLYEHHNQKITIGTKLAYFDGFRNIPWVEDIIEVKCMNAGIKRLEQLGFHPVYQITQQPLFARFKTTIKGNHSLIDTPLWAGRELGLPDFDQRPIFFPFDEEIEKTNSIIKDEPTIAIECEARSGQSWANAKDIQMIIDKYKDTHRILWLSNKDAPDLPCVDDLLRFSRREVIMCLRAADVFFSVGSGFFCASLALPKKWQPKKIVCLFQDHHFKYIDRLNELRWHDDLNWATQQFQLQKILNAI